MSKYRKPFMADLDLFFQAGIDPNTGLPRKVSGTCDLQLKQRMGDLLTVVDRQDALNRYVWENLPEGLDSKMIERILYYRYKLILFKMSDDKFYSLPFALDGEIDVYGRWRGVTPLPFAGGVKDEPWVKGLVKRPVYSLDELEDPDDACVIVRDYTNGIDQLATTRHELNQCLIDVEAECIPMLRTALINSTGVNGIRVGSEDEAANVEAANKAIENAALTAQPMVPIIGSLEFQQLTDANVQNVDDFLKVMQSVDNLRLQMLGLENGGVFEKQEHMLQDEQDLNSGSDAVALNDGLTLRQEACDLFNATFGTNITVRVNEEIQIENEGVAEEDDEDDVPVSE